MVTRDPEEFWRKAINEMTASLPEDGNESPELESIKSKKKTNDGARKVVVQKVITQVYIFTDVTGKMYTSNTSQKMQILGTMSLQRALKIAQEDALS